MRIHLTAVCGTAMGALACMLKEAGHIVTGSDDNVYPPMSDFLIAREIPVMKGFHQSHIMEKGKPDLAIIGNAVTKDNPEAKFVLNNKIPHMSMPQAVNNFFAKDKKIIMVTGTHGKTTTSAIMAHILTIAGFDPSFMIGGILKDYGAGFHIGAGEYMVIEGDEYDTAFFDKGPKFMHYDPYITIMTGIEFDHADIFDDLADIKYIFLELVKKVSRLKNSKIIACKDSQNLMDVLEEAKASFITYGKTAQSGTDWYLGSSSIENQRTLARIHGPGTQYQINTAMPGEHNLSNFLACAGAAQKLGIDNGLIQDAMNNFSGVKRRQEVRGIKKGIIIMDDFAHHPTAVKETIAAVKPLSEKGRLIAVFEPRTNTSMRTFFQNVYPKAFTQADFVCVCEPCSSKFIPQEQKFSIDRLVNDIKALGVAAKGFKSVEHILEFLPQNLHSGDLVLIMSNGGFDNIHDRLLNKI